MHYNKHILISIFLYALCSCKKENRFDLVKRTGKETVEERSLSGFTTLLLYDKFDVELVSDTINKAIVIAGKNIIGNIPTEIKDGILTIRNNNKYNWSRSYSKTLKVELHCNAVTLLSYIILRLSQICLRLCG